ncbi:hypothetical protein BV22DRAFT_1030418 [Leucogyrophana mollusca]|uniref:Uncharacterized protein n=1 Tax=Leucogyrophana mollusca TaxID=85980 RepID=A0ACB8BTR3_9AGAM|nr:hypothetical protein BV22DRAFT_1030418 [Leucogyrophana mollusca]
MWEFDAAKAVAVEHLTSFAIDPVKKIYLAREYDVQQWLVPALNGIARRSQPIGMKDAEKLGVDLALGMAAVRESLCIGPGGTLSVGERSVKRLDFTEKIKEMLAVYREESAVSDMPAKTN